MKKIILLAVAALLLTQTALATVPDEGMWLPLLIKRLNYSDMKKKGLKLTPEEIYSVNNSSLKDAVIQLGNFCSGEIVSGEGLVLTNHHCGYDAIATHSSVDHDYLTNGFWAMTRQEELHTPGLTVSFLIRMEDVTAIVLGAASKVKPEEADAAMEAAMDSLVKSAENGTTYNAEVKDMFHGNEFYLFVYETFRDVRLVGAPPSSIGKFGGDTDNWMWPRHTGDFSMFRVYAGKDNKPADYSPDNVPYKPKHFLPISLKGVKEGDFSMTMGYPGSTERYLPSVALEHKFNMENPDLIKLLGMRLEIMKKDMDAEDKVRIQLASSYASLANSWKYYIGQNLGLKTNNTIQVKKDYEQKFQSWADADPSRKEEYGQLLEMFNTNYKQSADILHLSGYMNVGLLGSEFSRFALKFFRLKRMMEAAAGNADVYKPQIEVIRIDMVAFFKEINKPTDQKIFAAMLDVFTTDIKADYHPQVIKEVLENYSGSQTEKFTKYAADVYAKSFLLNQELVTKFLDAPSLEVLKTDIGFRYIDQVIGTYIAKLSPGIAQFSGMDAQLLQMYEKGMQLMEPTRKFSPDANFTMRVSYGQITPYVPKDGVIYNYYTTVSGIIAKEDPKNEEFIVPSKEKELILAKDYGRYFKKPTTSKKPIGPQTYAGSPNELPTCFISTNDITGGNSGSPVINGNGELIGIAFDGNWESMTGDLVYNPQLQRTISVDIRYVLWCVDKLAGAGHLVKEMKLVE